MCGLCGFVDRSGRPVDPAVTSEMIRVLRHRGPDADGCLNDALQTNRENWRVFLGHTRLKIIDLSEAASQPLSNENGTVFVVFNGEIYNFRELRDLLEQKGHRFKSRSDTEVIVHAYEEFGDEFVRYLDGMFAFAVFDREKKRLILGRDRTGKKPLYYSYDGRHLTFGSEIKAILACPWVEREVAPENLPAYLVYGYVPTPSTLYRNILSLPFASYIVLDENGLRGPYTYWHLEFSDQQHQQKIPLSEATNRVRELMFEAVEKRLVSDVPLGALLSGGLDSSIVVGIMSKLLSQPVHTFSIGFNDHASYDERPYASMVAKHFQTKHTEFVVKPDALGLAERLLWHHDQPYGDSSAIPTYLVCRMARDHVAVALNGDGGDEVFGGYDRFLAALVAEKTPGFIAPAGRLAARLFSTEDAYKSTRRRFERFFELGTQSTEERFLGWIAFFKPQDLSGILNDDNLAYCNVDRIRDAVHQPFKNASQWALLHRLLYVNFVTYLPDDLHVKMDRMSMANSLETRSPMLDTALIEYVASLPPSMKIRFGDMKYLLKRAFKDMLPPAIIKRPKHGFGAPLGRWFRSSFVEPYREIVLTKNARINTFLNPNAPLKLLDEHLKGREHGYRLWLLFNLELWLRTIERTRGWSPVEPLQIEMSEA